MNEAPITLLLDQLARGETSAEDQLLPLVYERLRALAGRLFAEERPDHTLEPTALVHDAWLKLAGNNSVEWKSRAHFFAISAQAMRRLLVDHARARAASKRGGQVQRVQLAPDFPAPSEGSDILSLEAALEKLTALDPRQARLIELRFFSGLTVPEVAECMQMSTRTIEAEWTLAKAWLSRELSAS